MLQLVCVLANAVVVVVNLAGEVEEILIDLPETAGNCQDLFSRRVIDYCSTCGFIP